MDTFIALRDDVTISAESTTNIHWLANNQPMNISLNLPVGVSTALQEIQVAPQSTIDINKIVVKTDGPKGLLLLKQTLRQLDSMKLIQRRLYNESHAPLAELTSYSMYFRYKRVEIDPEANYIISRFAYIQREKEYLIISSPLGYAEVRICNSHIRQLITALFAPQSIISAHKSTGIAKEEIEELFQFLLNAEILTVAEESGITEEEQRSELAQWEFHDLLFYSRSRIGRATKGFGGAFSYVDKYPPLAGAKQMPSENITTLSKPDLTKLTTSLTDAMENRKSKWEYSAEPLDLSTVSEFLYRVGRVKSTRQQELKSPDHAVTMDITKRPYPSGGAAYPIELYLTVRECDGLAPGLYHYRAHEHSLTLVRKPDRLTNRLLDMGTAGLERPNQPQILITIAARFQRVQWKYEGVSYSLIMKECGVLYQNMYLVATALGIAGCALGGGDSDCFAQAIGSNFYEESSIGEFALGSLPQPKS